MSIELAFLNAAAGFNTEPKPGKESEDVHKRHSLLVEGLKRVIGDDGVDAFSLLDVANRGELPYALYDFAGDYGMRVDHLANGDTRPKQLDDFNQQQVLLTRQDANVTVSQVERGGRNNFMAF